MFGENVRDAGEGFGRFGLDLFGVLGAVEDLGDGIANDVAGTSDVGAVVDVHDAFGYLEIPTNDAFSRGGTSLDSESKARAKF